MNILFLTENFPPETNAAATRVYERACYWARWGHRVTVVTSAPNFPEGKLFAGYRNRWHQTETMDGLRVVRVKTFITANRGVALRTLDFLSFMASGVIAGLFERRPDVVVATSPQFFTAVGGWMLGAARRRPFVFELGDLWPASIAAVGAMDHNLFLRWMEKLELFLYRRSACVVALTEAFKANLVSRAIPAEKVAVVVNGVDTPRYAPRPRDAELAERWQLAGKFVVGYVGTHGMAHGLGNVLDAAERLRGMDEIRFVLVGAGAEREALMAAAARRGIGNVVFIPPQPKEAMPRIWSLCDVALVHLRDSPVFAEVIPSKMFEAMGMGLPLILAVPPGEATAILKADGAGLCVPPEDPEALAGATLALMQDTGLRAALGRASLAAAPNHSRERQAERMIRVLEAAAAGAGGQAGMLPLP
jgi:glycosyltransferase involved in cell wall biosynthesis